MSHIVGQLTIIFARRKETGIQTFFQIISSYVRHIWKSTGLKDRFGSTLDVLDEMRSIRCIERKAPEYRCGRPKKPRALKLES